jgi:hypothetical protein
LVVVVVMKTRDWIDLLTCQAAKPQSHKATGTLKAFAGEGMIPSLFVVVPSGHSEEPETDSSSLLSDPMMS